MQGYTHPQYQELLRLLAAEAQMTAQDYLNHNLELS